ncbi:Hypothetical predicted protein [Mytilus galloprovincialis]|uniref:B box-type domain-containing protein n=1 Tax=Mytilus galloprovincialis TaxID=29158 RepID=A0A8B6CRG9_MYTGA|nr:Hypothetical predicted protein [Mytilus galloprovincialis]
MASKMKMCDPCSRLNKSSEGLKYCTDCEDTLCTDCAALHSAVKLLASHHLVDVSVTTGNEFHIKRDCSDHEDMCFEFYCSDHDCLICRTCMANTHRTCGKIQPIDVAAKGCKTSSMLEGVCKDIASLLQSTKTLLEDRQKKKTSVGQSKANVLKEIAKFRHDINVHLDQLENKCRSEVDILERTISKTVGKELADADKRQHVIQNIWQQVGFFTKNGSESQLFIFLNTAKSDISRQAASLQDIIPSLETNDIGFEPLDLISVMKSFGSVKKSSIPCSVKYQHPKHMQAQTRTIPQKVPTKFEFEKKVNISEGRITCIAVTIDNKLLFCNDQTKQISLMDQTGQHLKSCTVTDGNIWGISIIPGTDEAVVTLPNKRLIQFFNITSFTLGRQIHVNIYPYGVAVVKDNVIVGSTSGEVAFIERVSGKCLKTLKVGRGQIVSIVPGVNDKDELLYCCEYAGGNMVIGLKFDGTPIFSHSLGAPMCLALDSKRNSYITGYYSNELHRLSADTKVDDILLKSSDGLDNPLAVAFNMTFEKLYISNDNRSVLIFNCK